MVPRLVPEILSKCAFCDEAVAVAVAGIGDSRSLIVDCEKYSPFRSVQGETIDGKVREPGHANIIVVSARAK